MNWLKPTARKKNWNCSSRNRRTSSSVARQIHASLNSKSYCASSEKNNFLILWVIMQKISHEKTTNLWFLEKNLMITITPSLQKTRIGIKKIELKSPQDEIWTRNNKGPCSPWKSPDRQCSASVWTSAWGYLQQFALRHKPPCKSCTEPKPIQAIHSQNAVRRNHGSTGKNLFIKNSHFKEIRLREKTFFFQNNTISENKFFSNKI